MASGTGSLVDYEIVTDALNGSLVLALDPGIWNDLRQMTDRLHRRLDDRISRERPGYAEMVEDPSQAATGRLASDERLLLYLSDKIGLCALVLGSGERELVRLPVTAEDAADLTERLSSLIQSSVGSSRSVGWGRNGVDPVRTSVIHETLETLYRDMVEPLGGHLRGVTHLTFMLPPEMESLPVHLLQSGTGEPLFERYSVSRTCSLIQWSLTQSGQERFDRVPANRERTTYWGFSNETGLDEEQLRATGLQWVKLEGARGGIERLSHARREILRSSSHFDQATVIQGPVEGAAPVVADAVQSDVLHVAAHALIDPQDPYESGILMGDGRTQGSVFRWGSIPYPCQNDLVVLSACTTAQGRGLPGQGLVSGASLWQMAGANTVAATLWPVNDAATSALTQSFLEYYAGGMDPSDAMQAAMRDARRRQPDRPDLWGAYAVYGRRWIMEEEKPEVLRASGPAAALLSVDRMVVV